MNIRRIMDLFEQSKDSFYERLLQEEQAALEAIRQREGLECQK
jgi:hypothetical protein